MEIKTTPRKRITRVLIVDDHPNTALTLARAISQTLVDVEVLTARSGEVALEITREWPADVLITDMVMPGINGLELIEKLQEHPAGPPEHILLITAYDIPGLKETARRLGVEEVVNKPFRPERICNLLARAIHGVGTPTSAPRLVEAKSPLKILVADDQPDNVTLLSRYLESEGYICLSASDGAETLARARSEMPDLILLDVNMPNKDGFQALQELRADPAIGHIPVIVLTAARLEPMDLQYALSIGADDYVTKPFDRRELMARIRTRLRVKEAEDIIRQRNRELNLLPEIGRELSARTDVQELMDIILRRATETLGALAGHILLLLPTGRLYKMYQFSGGVTEKTGQAIPDWEPLLSYFEENRQGLILKDTSADPRWPQVEPISARSAVVVPLMGRLHLLGLLCLVHEQPDHFSADQKLLLQALASQAAIALENAILYASAEQERQRLEAVLQSIEDAVLMFDSNLNLTLINRAGKELFPHLDEQTGTDWQELLPLLQQSRKANAVAAQKVHWPDGRKFAARVMPLDGGYLASLHAVL